MVFVSPFLTLPNLWSKAEAEGHAQMDFALDHGVNFIGFWIGVTAVENYGVKILSIGFFTKPDQAVVWRGPMASKALNQMIFDASFNAFNP